MIRDLDGAGHVRSDADVVVVGAGTIGLVLCSKLLEIGFSVLCVESGGYSNDDFNNDLNVAEKSGDGYKGAELGRCRGLGGTSARWGGAMIPFQASDMNGWPISASDLDPYVRELEEIFDLPDGSYHRSEVSLGHDFVCREAKWPRFSKRNTFALLGSKIKNSNKLNVWVNCTIFDFIVDNEKIVGVRGASGRGDFLDARGARVVLTAGAIECTRLLLLFDKKHPGIRTGAYLGKGFHDHLSSKIGEIIPADLVDFNKVFGFSFARRGAMRNLRFELSQEGELRRCLPPCFAHIGFSSEIGGFAALRDLFRDIQNRRLPSLQTILSILANSGWMTKAIWWKIINRKLLYPSNARIEVHMVVEQEVRCDNEISLSEDLADTLGLPRVRIHWAVSDRDKRSMLALVRAFDREWSRNARSQFGEFVAADEGLILEDMVHGGGIYHPGGTTRMAESSEQGVVDKELRVFGLPNLAICATSVLPTGGGANPTMMALLLALRLARGFRSSDF